jgi:hypothetical protein
LPALEASAGEMVAQLSDALAEAAEGGRVAAAETAKANEDLRVEVGAYYMHIHILLLLFILRNNYLLTHNITVC